MRGISIGIIVLSAWLAMAPGAVAAFEDPDWPCIQRKVARLSWGQMWSGPSLPDDPAWREDPALAPLVGTIAARRTGLDAVAQMVAGIATAGPDPTARLTLLFAGVFEQIDIERAKLIEGIGRYARKQRGLTERIDSRRDEIESLVASTAADDFDGLDRIDELEDALAWDTRIYQDRQKSLTFVCESPVLLEKRAFAVARIVQAALPSE